MVDDNLISFLNNLLLFIEKQATSYFSDGFNLNWPEW